MASNALEEQQELQTAKAGKDYGKIVQLATASKVRVEALRVLEELTGGDQQEEDAAALQDLLATDVCQALVGILQNPGTEDVAITLVLVCDVVANLAAADETFRQTFFALGGSAALVPAVEACTLREEQLAESCLFAISNLCTEDGAADNAAALGEHGAVEFLVKQAGKFGPGNGAVAGNACSALVNLSSSSSNTNNRARLLELDASAVVAVSAIQVHGLDIDQVGYLGFSALATLAVGLDGEVAAVSPEAAVALADCLARTQSVEVFEAACGALATVALNDVNRAQLGGAAHLCQSVVDQWKRVNVEVEEDAARLAAYECMLVANLAFNNPPNQTRLGKTGAIFLVVAELKDYGASDESVAKNACLAVGNLAARNSDNLLYMAGMQGLCDALVASLQAFGAANASVSKNACFAITTLAFNSKELKDKFREVPGCADAIKQSVDNQYKPYALHDVTGELTTAA